MQSWNRTCVESRAPSAAQTECPRELCQFWRDDTCVVAGLRADLGSTPGLPELLLGLRERLDHASPADDTLLPTGLR